MVYLVELGQRANSRGSTDALKHQLKQTDDPVSDWGESQRRRKEEGQTSKETFDCS